MRPKRRGRKPKSSQVESATQDLIDTDTTCQVCFAEFLDPHDLSQHKSQVHAGLVTTSFKCNFCDTRSTDVESYLLHLRDEHIANLICCIYCARAFIDPQEHKEHEKKHNNDVSNMLSCSNCTVFFNSLRALESHELTCKPDRPNSVMLQKHYPHLSSILNSRADEFMQSLDNKASYSCCMCKIVTSDIADYLKHLKRKDCRSLACNNCYHVFSLKMSLYSHFRHHGECGHIPLTTKATRLCIKCNKQIDAAFIKTHRKRCKAIQCVTCTAVFGTVTELTEHQRLVHPMALTLIACRYCRQQFGGLPLLRRHMKRVHSDYRMYKYTCVYCSQIFKHPNILFNHFYLKHKELQPFSCKICKETFKIRRKFTLHIKLKHNSIGFVEFDDKLNVYFGSEKSANPFQPKENTRLFDDSEKQRGESDTTDFETDVETKKTKSKRALKTKPKTGKPASNKTATEADNQDIVDKAEDAKRLEKIEPLTRKRRRLQQALDELDSTDDESLLNVRKRAKSKRQMQIQMTKINKHRFSNRISSLTCNLCKKNFFMSAHYHRHMTKHYNSEPTNCMKCGQSFENKLSLCDHLKEVHAMTLITDTLKMLIERRKTATLGQSPKPVESIAQKIRKTVRKFEIPSSEPKTTENKKLSVRNFLESFTPEVTDSSKRIAAGNTAEFKPSDKPKIKLQKFVEHDYTDSRGLQMPKPFKSDTTFSQATIKLHVGPHKTADLNFGTTMPAPTNDNYEDDYQYYDQDDVQGEDYHEEQDEQSASIPEVAQEVMLENTDEQQGKQSQQISRKLVLPKSGQDIKIAHLQKEAPFFKIVSMSEVLHNQQQKGVVLNKGKCLDSENAASSEIQLPSGKRLVHANPLAHLLEGKSLEEFRKFTEKKKKYYQPKYDHKVKLKEALMKMEEPPQKRVVKRKPNQKKKKPDVEAEK